MEEMGPGELIATPFWDVQYYVGDEHAMVIMMVSCTHCNVIAYMGQGYYAVQCENIENHGENE